MYGTIIYISLTYIINTKAFIDTIPNKNARLIIISGVSLSVISFGFGHQDGYSIVHFIYSDNLQNIEYVNDINSKFNCFIFAGKLADKYVLVRKDELALVDDKLDLKLKLLDHTSIPSTNPSASRNASSNIATNICAAGSGSGTSSPSP
jgi:hypothetical protein